MGRAGAPEGTAVDAALPQIPTILHGCKTFPCSPGMKVPATVNGWKDASDSPVQLAQWHSVNPSFNWAVACGPSNLFVLDIDPKGLSWWHETCRNSAEIREAAGRAYQVRTPRGGFHIYWLGEGPSTASRIAPGVDTRGTGGYVVLPGSHTPDGAYEELGGALEPLPDCIKALIPERKKVETKGLSRDPDMDQPRNVAWAVTLLKEAMLRGEVAIEGSGGNDQTYRMAARIMDKAISPGLCMELLLEHWNPHCAPSWEEGELEIIVGNAAKFGEETGKGSKGIQSNVDAFASFVMPAEEPEPAKLEPGRKIRFRPMTLTEARKNIKAPSWLIPGILPSEGSGILYGASGSFKSFLALDMALSLAHGIAGQWGCAPVPHKVLFLAGEQGHALIGQRVDSWCAWRDLPTDCENLIIVHGVPAIRDSDGWRDVQEGLLEMDIRPDLIVVDTLARAITGMKEDSNDDSAVAVKFMEDIAAHYGAFVLSLHHTGKDESKGARGASGWLTNPDVVLMVKKMGKSITSLLPKKLKDSDVPDHPQLFQVKEFGHSIVLEKTDSRVEMPKPGRSRTDWSSPNEVIAILKRNGGTMGDLMLVQEISGAVGIDKAVVRRTLHAKDDLKWLRQGHDWRYVEPEGIEELDL